MRPGPRLAAIASAVLVLLAVVVLVSGGRSSGHTVHAAFDSASNVIAGQQVRVAGVKVGEITSADVEDGDANVTLRIDDGRVWPLPRGTTATLRFGTSVGVGGRYVELTPGPRRAAPIPDGGVLARQEVISPVEFDDLLNTFDGPARADVRGVIASTGRALGPRGRDLSRALRDSPSGLSAVRGVLADLGADPAALRTLVGSAAGTARALADRAPELQQTLTAADTTFGAIATRSAAVRQMLDRAPSTLAVARRTLSRTDRSLGLLDALVSDLTPGARGLVAAAGPAGQALSTLHGVAPLARVTLRRAAVAAPHITALLTTGVPFIGVLRRVMDGAEPTLECVRPYTPELTGFLSHWGAFAKNYGADGHSLNTLVIGAPIPTATPLTSHQTLSTIPGLAYAYPRPPGLNATPPGSDAQVWLQPGCGIGPETLDATNDPEARK